MSVIFYPNWVWLPILLPTLIVFLIGMVGSVNLRVLFVAVGGFFILSSSSKLDAPKLFYLIGYAMAFGFALIHCVRIEPENRSLFAIALAFFALVVFSLPVALLNGNSLVNWFRDAASIALVAAAPIFALNARVVRSRLPLVFVFTLTGLIGAFVFSTRTLKGAADNRTALVSFFLPAALYLYAVAEAMVGRQKIGWALIAAAVITMILFSGSRGALVLTVIPLAMAVVGLRPSLQTMMKYLIEFAVLGTLVVVLFMNFSRQFDKFLGLSGDRTANHLLLISTLATDPSKDQSFQERLSETLTGLEAFMNHPITGVGPGYLFTFKMINRSETTFAMVDTPMEFPAKYGLIGVGILILVFYLFYRFLRDKMRRGLEPSTLALVGFGLFTLSRVIVSPPFDDKGYSMGFLFLLSLCLIDDSVRRAELAAMELDA
jgi:hypothetical protein